MPNTHRLPGSRPLRQLAAAAALTLASALPAHAIAFWDEVTLYLTHATYQPGSRVDTTFYFGSKPAVDLSRFDFTLTWDNALATPVANGPGSVESWMNSLSSKGSTSYAWNGPQRIQGSWVADPQGGAASFVSTSYDHLQWAVFGFDTAPTLKQPFVVSIELTNIRDGSGEIMDTGSGFINWANMTPVPEPGRWASMLLGMAALGAWRRATSRC